MFGVENGVLYLTMLGDFRRASGSLLRVSKIGLELKNFSLILLLNADVSVC
jgi:hypothetical protein